MAGFAILGGLARGVSGDKTGGFAASCFVSGAPASGLAARGFFRNGFVCFVTLSQSARSSSLKMRFRRSADNSTSEIEGGLFIG